MQNSRSGGWDHFRKSVCVAGSPAENGPLPLANGNQLMATSQWAMGNQQSASPKDSPSEPAQTLSNPGLNQGQIVAPEAFVYIQILLGPSATLPHLIVAGQAVVLQGISQLQDCGPAVPAMPK